MLIHGIWVTEQQFAWSKRNFSFPKGNEGQFYIATSPFYAASFAAVSMAPYYGIASLSNSLSYKVESTVARYALGRSLGFKVGRRRLAKLLATKVASRFVPGLGWALLMVDAWHVGKWIGDKTNPFD
ncbi:MAG TPA: hypothetical protein EYN33_00355 [Gammaproteobacteria bacterium]|nr:hypothetical protein [Gammaproteobacteria bacterium]